MAASENLRKMRGRPFLGTRKPSKKRLKCKWCLERKAKPSGYCGNICYQAAYYEHNRKGKPRRYTRYFTEIKEFVPCELPKEVTEYFIQNFSKQPPVVSVRNFKLNNKYWGCTKEDKEQDRLLAEWEASLAAQK